MFKGLLSLLTPSSGVPSDERRDTIRLDCRILVTMTIADKTYSARVVNVSLTGLCLELENKIKAKQTVTLAREEFGQPLSGRAVWCRSVRGTNKHQVGVQYNADQQMLRASWLKPALKTLGFKPNLITEKRKLLRVPGKIRCVLKALTGDVYTEGELLDLSIGGALVEGEVELPDNLKVILETDPVGNLKPLTPVGKIVSCNRNVELQRWRCGIQFTESDLPAIRKYMKALMADC